jgi:hypothetical protein
VVVGQDFVLSSGEEIDGNLAVLGGDATLRADSAVRGDVAVLGGALSVAGTVTGDIVVFGGDIQLKDGALVEGNVAALGGSIERSPDAIIEGESFSGLLPPGVPRLGPSPEDLPVLPVSPPRPPLPLRLLLWPLKALAVALGMALLGGAVALLAPRHVGRVASTAAAQPFASFAVGFLTYLAAGLAGLLLLIACCSGLLVWLVLAVAVTFGWIAVGFWFGQWLFRALKVSDSSGLFEAAVGVFIVTFLARVLPCIGVLFGFVLAALGLGAVVLTRFGTRAYPEAPHAATDLAGLLDNGSNDAELPGES